MNSRLFNFYDPYQNSDDIFLDFGAHKISFFRTGVPTDKNGYSCPILAVHTWKKTQQNKVTETGVLHTVGISGGYSSNINRNTTMLAEAGNKVEFKVGVDEEIQMIPVEDIILIKISTEVKKAVEQKKTARRKHKLAEKLTCCQEVKNCCMKNFCCCCHVEKIEQPDFEIMTNQKQEAARIITVTIEHLRYGLVHTPSLVHVLSEEKKAEFYEKHKKVDTLQFYYLHNETFDEGEYKMQLRDSESLARLVMQLKAMHNRYPDETQLQKMIQQNFSHYYGQKLTEDIPILQGAGEVTTTTARGDKQLRLTTN